MARNGSGVYSLPAGYEAVTGETILATQHNTPLEDLAADANDARPVVAGGTGGTTVTEARDNISAQPQPVYEQKTASYTALLADKGKYFEFTNTRTLALQAAATLGAKWTLYVRANGGTVTIDPNGSETINGDTTFIVNNGASVLIICTGTSFEALYLPTRGWEHIVTTEFSATNSWAQNNLSGYRKLRISGFMIPTTDAVQLYLRTSSNNGSSYDSGATDYSWQRTRSQSTTLDSSADADDTNIPIGWLAVGNQSSEGIQFTIDIDQFNQAAYCFVSNKSTVITAAGALSTTIVDGLRLQATARDAVQLLFSSGTIAGGYVVLEGMRI